MAIRQWSSTASGNAAASTINWAEGMAPSVVNNSARQMMAEIRTAYAPLNIAWAEFSATASVGSQTVFRLGAAAGDVTSHFHASRRTRHTGGSATRYGTISSSSFTAETTVTIAVDSGSLSASMSIVALGPAVTSSPIKVLQSMVDLDRIADLTTDTPVAADLMEFADISAGNESNKATITDIVGAAHPAWTAFTPTIAAAVGTITTKSATGRQLTVGKMVFIQMEITITTNGTGATAITASLPSTPSQRSVFNGYERAVLGFQVRGEIPSGSATCNITKYDATYPGADGHIIVMSGVYEIA